LAHHGVRNVHFMLTVGNPFEAALSDQRTFTLSSVLIKTSLNSIINQRVM